MATDLQRAFETLTDKTKLYSTLWAFYEGDQPLIYSTARLREVFQRIDARFSENWCAVIVDSEAERIQLKEFSLPRQEPNAAPVTVTPALNSLQQPAMQQKPQENPVETRLNELFSETELDLDADAVHLAALVCGESYIIVWRDADVGIEAYYQDPRMCHVFYDEEHPRMKRFAAKWWVGEADEKRYLNLYYADRIEYYVSTQKAKEFSTWKGMKELLPAEDNPFGEVPVFHFRTDRRKTTSRLSNVVPLQNAENKLFADEMVAAEFAAFKQRYVISTAGINTLKNAPNEIWDLPGDDGTGQPTQVGELSATELKNYTEAMDRISRSIGAISRTPKHYFFAQGGDPSGEALIAMEAPLNKKAQKAINNYKPTWAEVGVFLLKLDGTEGVQKKDVTPTFAKPETVQPRTQAEIRQMDVNAGIPLETSLRREGWTESELAQLAEDKANAQAQANALIQGGKLQQGDMKAVTDRLEELGIGDLLEDVNGRSAPAT